MEYKCSKCGATLKYIDNRYTCEYCKSVYNYADVFDSSNYILPFNVERKDAINKYKSLINSKFLTPKPFKKKRNIEKIEGIYVPCLIYDFEASGVIRTKSNLVSEWKSKGIKYKKTDEYQNMRSGHMSLENIYTVCNDSLDINIDLVEPYDLKEVVTYNKSLQDNYKVYDYNLSKSESLKVAEEKARKYFEKIMIKDIKDYKDAEIIDSSINLYNTKTKCVLIPVWILNITYKNKKFTYLINGRTGKISGKMIIKKSKIYVLCAIIFILVFCMLVLFNIFGV